MIKEVKDVVLNELSMHPETRDSDRILIAYVYRDFFGIADEPFEEVMMMSDLPSFETIRRARQKAQEHDPALRGSKTVREYRAERRLDFYEFAISN